MEAMIKINASALLPVNYFCEHCDYNVIRKDKLGGGSNGAIFPVYLQSDRSLQMVVKEVGCFFVAVRKIWKP